MPVSLKSAVVGRLNEQEGQIQTVSAEVEAAETNVANAG